MLSEWYILGWAFVAVLQLATLAVVLLSAYLVARTVADILTALYSFVTIRIRHAL